VIQKRKTKLSVSLARLRGRPKIIKKRRIRGYRTGGRQCHELEGREESSNNKGGKHTGEEGGRTREGLKGEGKWGRDGIGIRP